MPANLPVNAHRVATRCLALNQVDVILSSMGTNMILGKQNNGTFIIPAHRVGELKWNIDKMARRSKRTGKMPLNIEVIDNLTLEHGPGCVILAARVRIVGEVPRIAGHEFLARIEHHAVGNIVTRAPNALASELPESLRTDAATCDHCSTKRARKDTFVLRAEDGSLKRIGRTCLADYLRTDDIADALRIWKYLSDIEDALSETDSEGGGGGSIAFRTADFLATVARVIEVDGWVSRRKRVNTSKQPTYVVALQAMLPPPRRPDAHWTARQPDAKHREEAAAIITWAAAQTGSSDYVHNLRVALSLDVVERRNMGLVASAVVSYRKDQAIAFERCAVKPVGTHVGEIGQRLNLELTVMSVRYAEGDYGVTTIVGFQDVAGNDLVWFASGSHDYEVGQQVRGKGTIKAHKAYNGRPQTVVSRCSFEVVRGCAQDLEDALTGEP